MTLGRLSVLLALASAAASLKFLECDSAEDRLSMFYSRLMAADFNAARRDIDEAIRLWPSNSRYYAWRGYARVQEMRSQCPAHGAKLDAATFEQAREAAAEYRQALERDNRDGVAHHNLAWLYHLMGRNQQAQQEWEQAIAIDPATAIYHLSLGFFLEETGDPDGAGRQYAAAVELAPATLDSPFFTRYRRRSPEWAEGVVHEAIGDLENGAGSKADPIVKARLGKLYLYRGNLSQAAELLATAANDLPNLPMAWFNLGEVRRLQGNREQAQACYRKARFLDPDLAGPPLRLAEIYRQDGQRDAAVESTLSAVRKWAHYRPIPSQHNTRLYRGISQPVDDLLPTTLVWYATECQASEAYKALAELFPENEVYAARSRTCETVPAPHSGN